MISLDDRQRVAASQLTLPAMGLGCGTLGDPDLVISEHQAQQTLEAAWKAMKQEGVLRISSSVIK